MTNEEVGLLKDAILDSTEAYVDTRFKRLPFVKTEIGVIEGVGTNKGNKVRLNKVVQNGQVIKEGILYDNVLSVGNIIFPNGSIVFIFVPNGQYNNMFIMGQLDDTPANIKGGTINIGNGKFKVDSNGNADIHGDIKVVGALQFYWDSGGGLETGYYDSITLGGLEVIPTGTFPLIIFEQRCEFSEDIYIDKDLDVYGRAYFHNNVYNSSGGVVFVSDKNAKHDIESLDLEKSANFIYSQNPVSYKFNDGTSNRKHHGFIAQDVKESMGEEDWGVYIDQSINDESKKNEIGSIGLRYDEYIADIVATCQYQKQQIDEMKKEIEELKNKIKGADNNGND